MRQTPIVSQAGRCAGKFTIVAAEHRSSYPMLLKGVRIDTIPDAKPGPLMENTAMRLEKHQEGSEKIVPVIAALPFRVHYDRHEAEEAMADVPTYDPSQQRTIYEARDFSTSRENDSAGGLFSTKSDTKKDD